MKTIYLAGNIEGCHYNEVTGWRDAVTCDLIHRFKILNPMRDKEQLRDSIVGFQHNSKGCTAQEIFRRDTDDVFQSDIILAYITDKTIGTSWELGMAWTLDKHIVIVTTPELAGHPFLSESADYLTNELDDAVKYLLDKFS